MVTRLMKCECGMTLTDKEGEIKNGKSNKETDITNNTIFWMPDHNMNIRKKIQCNYNS